MYDLVSQSVQNNPKNNLAPYLGENTSKLIKLYNDRQILSEELFSGIWDRGKMNHETAELSNRHTLSLSLLMDKYQLTSHENCLQIFANSGHLYMLIPILKEMDKMGKLSPNLFQNILNGLRYAKIKEIENVVKKEGIENFINKTQLEVNSSQNSPTMTL